ncbi:MAG: polysaccharide deacetylase family protein [Clostridiales bacterium]|nr:polysaccharide deacetylase family protein [Clostridiales bacterium]
MRDIGRRLLFADFILGILIVSLLFCGKISGAGSAKRETAEGAAQGQTETAEDEVPTGTAATGSEASEAKKIALTFDDGPDGAYTPLLLDGLRERGVHVTFFLLGTQIELYPEIVEEMFADGHEIGIHSYEHVDLESLSEAAACEQIQKTGDRICELTGEWPSFVRPPYGNWLSALDNDFCLVTVMWNVDPLDWATDDTTVITQRILENTEEYDIILLHDASASSVEAAFQVIDELSRENYEFVTVEELIFP